MYMKQPDIETRIINPLLGSSIPLPQRATNGSAALDLRACLEQPVTIKPGETVVIPGGFAININDPDIVAILAPRSGLGIKHGLVLANCIGVIDSDYQGEIKIGLHNQSKIAYTVQPGERVCQMMFMPVMAARLQLVDSFSTKTDRGDGGLGSTGTD